MSAYTDLLNRRQNMTKEERDADILREAFGPMYGLIAPYVAQANDEPDTEKAAP